ncbi:MAG: hypothetical protein R2751_15130 [Bacteroidales bacterium]
MVESAFLPASDGPETNPGILHPYRGTAAFGPHVSQNPENAKEGSCLHVTGFAPLLAAFLQKQQKALLRSGMDRAEAIERLF